MDTLFIKLKVNHIFQQTVALVTFKSLGKIHFYIDPYTQTEDLLFNPRNPENPWFKTRGKWINIPLKPVGEKTRGIASLRIWKLWKSWFKIIYRKYSSKTSISLKTHRVPTRGAPTQILCAQQLMVWIRIFRISRINDNVVGLRGKVNIRWHFHFEASRRCVTHRRKRR